MRSPLNALLTEKALHAVSIRRNAELTDHILNNPEWDPPQVAIKNVCAKVSVELSDEIDEVVGLLGISSVVSSRRRLSKLSRWLAGSWKRKA